MLKLLLQIDFLSVFWFFHPLLIPLGNLREFIDLPILLLNLCFGTVIFKLRIHGKDRGLLWVIITLCWTRKTRVVGNRLLRLVIRDLGDLLIRRDLLIWDITVQPSLGITRGKLERIFKNAWIEVLSVIIGVSCSLKHI